MAPQGEILIVGPAHRKWIDLNYRGRYIAGGLKTRCCG